MVKSLPKFGETSKSLNLESLPNIDENMDGSTRQAQRNGNENKAAMQNRSRWPLLILVVVAMAALAMGYKTDTRTNAKTGHSSPMANTKSRTVAIGDVHGDLEQTLKTLRMAGIIDAQSNWAAGSTTFVQTGDVVDRGPDTIKLYRLFMKLTEQAAKEGGRVHQLLGNHEVMNMQEDLRYVTPEDTATFGSAEARREAFSSSGWIGTYLRGLNITIVVDRTVFFHGGAKPEWAKMGTDAMNEFTHESLIGKEADDIWGVKLFGNTGPLWYRGYAQDAEAKACALLDKALASMNADRMVVGHTPQADTGRILRRCDGRFYVIDVGISRVYGGHSAALEIVDGRTVNGLYPGGRRVPLG